MLAGGAVIAEQIESVNYNLEKVEFLHADPVTGSTTRTSMTGEDQGRTEYEALGQEVQTDDPPIEPVGAVGISTNTADEPEWLCQMHARNGTDFFEMPVQCRVSALNNQKNLKNLFPSESDPHKISGGGQGADQPNMPPSESAADRTMTYALRSSAKKTDDEGGGSDGCKYDEEGRPECAVQSEKWIDPDVPGFVGADVESNFNDPLSEADRNSFIASLFGGAGATVRTNMDIDRKSETTELRPDGTWIYKDLPPKGDVDRSKHLFKDGVFHIYTDEYGSVNKETGLFVPKGATVAKKTGEYKSEGEWKNEFVFNLSGEYKGVSIDFVHVGGTYGGPHKGNNLGKEFIDKKDKLIGKTNDAGSTQIGYIGGLGGSNDHINGIYRHSHVVAVFRDFNLLNLQKKIRINKVLGISQKLIQIIFVYDIHIILD